MLSSSSTGSLSSESSASSSSSTSRRHKHRRGRRERLREKQIEAEVCLRFNEFKAYMNSMDEYASDPAMRDIMRQSIKRLRSAQQVHRPQSWEDLYYEQMC